MARNTVDVCMICDQVDCRCNKRPAKKAVPKKAVPKIPAPASLDRPKPNPPVRVAPTRTGAGKTGEPDQAVPSLARVKSAREIEDEELGRAITCFAEQDMLHRDELIKYRRIINLPPHRIDAMIWKQDNEAELERRSSE